MTDHAVDTVSLTLRNGEQRELLLTMGALRRLKKQLKLKSVGEIFQQDGEEAVLLILYEALPDADRRAWDLDKFADELPAHLPTLAKTVAQVLGASFPEAKQDGRPPQPNPTVQ